MDPVRKRLQEAMTSTNTSEEEILQWAKLVKDRRALDMRSVLQSLKSRAEELGKMAYCELANPRLFHEVCKFPIV
jgi:hypothetical protein